MKKIIFSLSVIVFVIALAAGGTRALFFDTEVSENNTFLTGTIDIDVDDENPWTGEIQVGDIKPGESRDYEWTINNAGTYPANIWLAFENLTAHTGAQSEPECVAENGIWDEDNQSCTGMTNEDNRIDEVLDYSLRVEVYAGNPAKNIFNQILYAANYTLGEVAEQDMILGMIPVGGYMKVFQIFEFQYGAGNEYQGDYILFDTKIAAEQLRGQLVLENKDKANNYIIQHDDGYQAILNFTPKAPEFSYNLVGKVPAANRAYSLIYYSDPYDAYRGLLIGEAMSDAGGNIAMSGSADIASLPLSDDAIYPYGAKIQLVPTNSYAISGGRIKITQWGYWNLFLTETALVYYEKTDFGPVVIPDAPTGLPSAPEADGGSTLASPTVMTADFDTLGSGIGAQYGYNFDYTSANVSLAYTSPDNSRLNGTITASGLKPYATYQIKFVGQPECLGGSAEDEAQNEYIGSIGRWWDNTTNSNATDAQKTANPGHCYTGYLMFDYFTADASGNASKAIATANSFHVLWSGGGVCDTTANTYLDHLDSDHPTVLFSPADKVDGEIERFACNGLNLNPGIYDLKIALTEECFHQTTLPAGTMNWAEVLTGNIQFEIQ